MTATKKLLIATLEPSGDLHAAHLIRELIKFSPGLKIYGVGGTQMKAAGAKIILNTTKKGVVGLIEALPFIPGLLLSARKVINFMDREKPDTLICVDSQGFNLLLAAAAKKRGIKTIYYVAPQEWLWGTKEGLKKVAEKINLLIAIFKQEATAYKKTYQEIGKNVNQVFYCGHPLLDIVKPSLPKEAMCKKVGLDSRAPIIALFFGNRKQEITNLVPLMLKAAKQIKEKVADCQFVAPLFNQVFKKKLQRLIKKQMPTLSLVDGENYNIINAADVVLSTPGTVTLECAILETPVVAVYKVHPITYFIAEKILKFSLPYFTMPSILAKHLVVPEYIQKAAVPENIAEEIIEIIKTPSRAKNLVHKLREVKKQLGTKGVIKKVADKIIACYNLAHAS